MKKENGRKDFGRKVGKNIKRFIIFSLMTVILTAQGAGAGEKTAAAEETTTAERWEKVRIDSVGMEMKVPAEWVTINAEMEDDDPVFEQNHMDGSAMLENYKEHGILLDSIHMGERVEFNVESFGKDKNIVHLTQFSEEGVQKYAEGLLAAEGGPGLKDYQIYDGSQARFITGAADLKTGSQTADGVQYYTIVNGNRLCFQMFSFDGELSEENKNILKSVIDSVRFDSLQEAGSLAMSRKKNPVLAQLSPKYLLRNLIIVLGAVLLVYYGMEAGKGKNTRKKKK